ncbi:MAG: DUF885 domain-containing protein [Planctomycetes bacterium]|nr:DUF885 domain-containing protein [Planctomycetota bacterium]
MRRPSRYGFASLTLLSGALLMTNCTVPPRPASSSASAELARLADEMWQLSLESEPTYATYLGDHRWNDRLTDLSAEGRARTLARFQKIARRVADLDVESLNETERVTRDILLRKIDDSEQEDRIRFYEWAVDQMNGPQVEFFQQLNFHPFRNAKDVKDLVSRFLAFTRYMDQYLDNLRAGLRNGRVAPRIAVERVLAQTERIAAETVETCPLHGAVGKLPEDLPESERTELRKSIEDAIGTAVLPAFRKFRDFLKDEYLTRSRESVGVCAMPGGTEAYAFRVRSHTTTDLTPEALHQIGLGELKQIGDEMVAIARRRGFTGDAAAFNASIRGDRSNFATSREQILEGYREVVARVQTQLPKYFRKLPKCPVIVKPIEEYREKDCVAAFYYPPTDDFSRPGIYYANTYDPPTRSLFGMAALSVHEAIPGHHLQIALAMELDDLPELRQHSGFTAFVEGWALYSERLADEMGIYRDDLERFGMLTYQAWRATRLVVDTGIHRFGWTRQQAIDFFKTKVALSEAEIVNEVDRYIIWPGQALAYKVGQREIMALRAEAGKALGDRFDLREFHDVVLRNGAIPLTTLRGIVEGWIREKGR